MKRSNQLVKRILANPCPVCNAGVGEKCDKSTTNVNNPYHYARFLLADAKPGSKVQKVLDSMVLKPEYPKGSNPTNFCKKGSHNNCPGSHKSIHGYRAVCTCHCHNKGK